MPESPFLEVTWHDPESGHVGHLVIDRLIRGVCGGGLRMRAGCTLEEVTDLARAMSVKEAIAYDPADRYQPLGGAKGGIDCDPAAPGARAVLTRYVAAMRPLIERFWTVGEDCGVRQEVLDEIVDEIGMRSSIEAALRLVDDPDAALARVADGFAVQVDGVGLGELVGGYGVARATLTAMEELGTQRSARVVVQGFGSMGGATARYLAAAGLRVVGLCDVEGVVANPAGLDVERLLLTRTPQGTIDRRVLAAGDAELSGDRWLQVETDVLVPAAMSYVLTGSVADAVSAHLVVEAANVATDAEAQTSLAARGVVVLPDVVANLATNAWWWWTFFGDIRPDATASFAKIDATMDRLVGELLTRSRVQGVLPRVAALQIAAENLERLVAADAAGTLAPATVAGDRG